MWHSVPSPPRRPGAWSRARAWSVAFLAAVLVAGFAGGCRRVEAPPTGPMVEPRAFEDLTGIWRTVRQGVLEIRADGRYVLISPITRPAEGRVTLAGARVSFVDPESCDGASGTYTVSVAAASRMVLSDPDDPCADRRTVLVTDPFVYTPR